jgi:hypothetical protein
MTHTLPTDVINPSQLTRTLYVFVNQKMYHSTGLHLPHTGMCPITRLAALRPQVVV